MSELEKLLQSLVAHINSSSESLKKVQTWINGYRGKIVQLITKRESFHLVFTNEAVSLRKGEYPSGEITYYGEESVLLRILKGQASASSETKAGNLTLWGNMHESLPFEGLLKALA